MKWLLVIFVLSMTLNVIAQPPEKIISPDLKETGEFIDSIRDFHFPPTKISDSAQIDSVFYWVRAKYDWDSVIVLSPNKLQMHIIDQSQSGNWVGWKWTLTNDYVVYGIKLTYPPFHCIWTRADLDLRLVEVLPKRIRVINGDTVHTHIQVVGRDVWYR